MWLCVNPGWSNGTENKTTSSRPGCGIALGSTWEAVILMKRTHGKMHMASSWNRFCVLELVWLSCPAKASLAVPMSAPFSTQDVVCTLPASLSPHAVRRHQHACLRSLWVLTLCWWYSWGCMLHSSTQHIFHQAKSWGILKAHLPGKALLTCAERKPPHNTTFSEVKNVACIAYQDMQKYLSIILALSELSPVCRQAEMYICSRVVCVCACAPVHSTLVDFSTCCCA